MKKTSVGVAESADSTESLSLRHIVVCAGTLSEWARLTESQWLDRLDQLAVTARQSGAKYVTLQPYGPSVDDHLVDILLLARRMIVHGVHISVQPIVDGRQTVCDALAKQDPSTTTWSGAIAEATIDSLMFGLFGEPDLVVIVGPSDRLPASLMWELAYSELVFIDSSWLTLDGRNIAGAIEEFQTRDRRFGGVEA